MPGKNDLVTYLQDLLIYGIERGKKREQNDIHQKKNFICSSQNGYSMLLFVCTTRRSKSWVENGKNMTEYKWPEGLPGLVREIDASKLNYIIYVILLIIIM